MPANQALRAFHENVSKRTRLVYIYSISMKHVTVRCDICRRCFSTFSIATMTARGTRISNTHVCIVFDSRWSFSDRTRKNSWTRATIHTNKRDYNHQRVVVSSRSCILASRTFCFSFQSLLGVTVGLLDKRLSTQVVVCPLNIRFVFWLEVFGAFAGISFIIAC